MATKDQLVIVASCTMRKKGGHSKGAALSSLRTVKQWHEAR